MSCGACSVRWGRFIRCCTSCTCREVRWVRASWCVRSSCGLRRCAAAGCGSRDGGMHRYPRQFGSLITVFEVKLKKWESKCQKHVPVKGLGSLPPCSTNNTKPEAGSVVAVAFRGLNAAASVSLLHGPFEASPGLCRSRYSWIGTGAERGEGLTPWLLCARVSARLRGSVRKETWQTVQLGNLPLPLLGASPSEGAAEASGWRSRGRAWCAAPRGDVKAPNPWASPPLGDTGGVKLH